MFDILLINLLLFAGAFVQGIVGFGLGVLSAPLIFMVEPAMIPAPMILNSIFLCCIIARDNKEAIDKSILSWPIIGTVVGSAAAASLLFGIDDRLFALVFASLLLLLIILSCMRLNIPINPFTGLLAGFFSALSGTITAIGGPPIALLWQNLKPKEIRGNISIFFIASSMIALVALAVIGKFGWAEIKLSAMTLPGVFVGFYSSRLIANKIPAHIIRYGVLLLSSVSSLMLLAKYI
ncbi:sulfite exporter TauE/SafE family protein [Catenovulum sediminis]|uniref:Probable membrane transporter protein n=1 Tax=Catenovulum sediminis TaxID=1740262 RepID=A0ABV1RHV7_9ALTE|nr:sulfite exporter TauE/SafE family protein [Catenovulum sediminis]